MSLWDLENSNSFILLHKPLRNNIMTLFAIHSMPTLNSALTKSTFVSFYWHGQEGMILLFKF